MNRRTLLKSALLGSAALAIGGIDAKAQSQNTLTLKNLSSKKKHYPLDAGIERVLIIGSGFGGLSVAHALRAAHKTCEIMIFDPKNIFAACPYSNLWLSEVSKKSYDKTQLYSPLMPAKAHRYSIIKDKVVQIDRKTQTVETASAQYRYTFLVIATGVEYDYSTLGLDTKEAALCYAHFPPSYQGGEEQLALKKQLENFKGGDFVITVPKYNYRCPPAPYERACLVADYFKRKHIDGKVILIDPRDKPAAKPKGFLNAFATLYPDTIVYNHGCHVSKIDVLAKKLTYEKFDAQEKKFLPYEITFTDANIIPSNKASFLLVQAGLSTTQEGWARAKSPSFRSLEDDNIYLVGDVLGEYPYPKSAQMANSCGDIVGTQIGKRLLEGKIVEDHSQMPSNVCYSLVSSTFGISVSHFFSYDEKGGVKVEIQTQEESNQVMIDTVDGWYFGLMDYLFIS